MDVWKTTFIHMVKTETGTYFVSDLLVDICDCFMHHMEIYNVKNSKHLKMIKPDTMIFNLVLEACVRFKLTIRAERIIELMAVVGVVADANTIVLIAQIHEMNGQRDELKKFKDYIDRVPARLLYHYRQFYDCLLSLHFKFDDIDAAAELVLDMCKHHGSSSFSGGFLSNNQMDLQKTYLIPIASRNLKTGLRLQIEPKLLQKDYVLSVGSHPELATFIGGRLVPSNKALAKVIHGYRKHGKIGDLSKTIVSIQKASGVMQKLGLSSSVLGSCIQIRWLETSHDILDDMELAGTPMDFEAYLSLLSAYSKERMTKEAKVLIKQMRKRGWLQDLSDEDVVSGRFLEKGSLPLLDKNSVTVVEKSGLAESLIRELKEEENTLPRMVYEINTSIYFFCKGNMMEDALRTYQRMQEREIQPTVQTFTHLINGYSKLKMYREITILWGEIKRKLDSGDLSSHRELHDMLLWNFIRGGYFERVLEVIEYMKRSGMYIDKWKYKSEFLMFHKYLYRSLKEEQAKTEAQRKRLEHVRAFRKWACID
ncbi:Pentatricopeptide repeat-containing protein [Thalictrum thalictroides]|uniref:Pentatricopeptide repeat-containing protein n=1 Tax=Thalictrum thalictroides TaxID=46969 RepID=A0A7J6W795_THATH|nr:Pentatricopeptide repeat-containing protein [Thalictrum thalictroides]